MTSWFAWFMMAVCSIATYLLIVRAMKVDGDYDDHLGKICEECSEGIAYGDEKICKQCRRKLSAKRIRGD